MRTRLWIGLLLALAFMMLTLPAYSAVFNLSWTDNSNNEDGFKIERRVGQTGTFSEIGSVNTDVTNFYDTTPDNQEYCYQVRAFNLAGASAYTNTSCGTLQVITVPDAPSGLGTIISPVIVIINNNIGTP